MDIPENLKVWQLAGGPLSRPYSNIFIDYSVGLIGPGDSGPWKDDRDDNDFDGGFVRRFATEMSIGDIVLLRIGISTIIAVGIVASKYQYLDQFDDVNGWDLQHARRIRWCKLPKEYTFNTSVFGANPSRISRSWSREIIEFAYKFINSPPRNWQEAILPDLPDEEPILEEIPKSIEGIVALAMDLYRLYWSPALFGDHPTEYELVSHFVVPLMRSMGWPSEKIAVEWRDIDVAVFKSLPRSAENCHFIIEAKRLGAGVEGALDQAKGYLDNIGIALDVIVTDGIRYRMYSYEKDFKPIAYANLIKLKKSSIEFFNLIKNK